MSVELWQGDCLELMRNIPDGSVDMVLCDLPYGVTRNKWDEAIPFDSLWKQYNRVCKPNAAICLFGQMPFTAALVMSNPKMFRYEWIWQKSMCAGFLNAHKMPLKVHEVISVFYKKLPTYNPQMRTGFKPYVKDGSSRCTSNYGKYASNIKSVSNGERFPVDVIKFANGNHGSVHPTQKPVPLLEYLIKTYTDEGETVLDNTMGSGSTGVACVNTNRNFIGIELDETYFEIAEQRIKQAENELGV